MKKVLVCLAICSAPLFTHAAGGYFEGQAGIGHYQIDSSSFYNDNTNDNAIALNFIAGYDKKLSNNKLSIGIETGIGYLGDASMDVLLIDGDVEALNMYQWNIDVLFTAGYSLSKSFSLFAKVGPSIVAQEYSLGEFSDIEEESKLRAKFAVGAEYAFNDKWSMTTTVYHTTGDTTSLNKLLSGPHTSTTTRGMLGLRYRETIL